MAGDKVTALIEINRNPSRRELNWFGFLLPLFFGLVGGLIWWRFKAPVVAWVVWGVAAGVTLLFVIVAPVRKPLYLGWMYAVLPIGWTISHVLLAAIYYLVFTPIGLIMRLAGRDPLRCRFDPLAGTYWQPHDPHEDASRYFRQF